MTFAMSVLAFRAAYLGIKLVTVTGGGNSRVSQCALIVRALAGTVLHIKTATDDRIFKQHPGLFSMRSTTCFLMRAGAVNVSSVSFATSVVIFKVSLQLLSSLACHDPQKMVVFQSLLPALPSVYSILDILI